MKVEQIMSVAPSGTSYRDFQRAVDGQLEAGFAFGQIEDFIDASPIDEEQKAALWLEAWVRQSADVRRTAADLVKLYHPHD